MGEYGTWPGPWLIKNHGTSQMGRILATVRFTFIPILQMGKAEVGAGLAQGHRGSGPLPIPLSFIGFSLEFMP